MKGMFAARAWGVGIALVCWSISACATVDSIPTASNTSTISSLANLPLSRNDTRKALLARSRAERHGGPPSQTISRIIDKNGVVLRESFYDGKGWTKRPSTLPASIAAKPLRDFLSRGASLVYDSTAMTVEAFGGAYVGADSVTTVNGVDTIVTPAYASYQELSHSTDVTGNGFSGDAYWPSAASIGDLSASTSGVALVEIPGGDAYEEFDASSSDWEWGMAAAIADTAGWLSGSLRMHSMMPFNSPRTDVTVTPVSHLGASCETSIEPAAFRTQYDPCGDLRHVAMGGLWVTIGIGLLIGTVAVAATVVGGPGAGGTVVAKTAPYYIGLVGGEALAMGAYAHCRAENPQPTAFEELTKRYSMRRWATA